MKRTFWLTCGLILAAACLNIVDFKDPVRARLMLFNDISHYADQPHRPHAHLSKWWDANGPVEDSQ
jgi:hypothetical protein